jgi:hypothetical protein
MLPLETTGESQIFASEKNHDNLFHPLHLLFYRRQYTGVPFRMSLCTVLAAKYPGNCKLPLRLSSRVHGPSRGTSVFYRTEKYRRPYTGVPFRVSLGTVLAAKYPDNCKLSLRLSSRVHGPRRRTSVFYRTE